MSKTHRFSTGDGQCVFLNSMQLHALLNLPASNASWPTYWALRRRNLIDGSSPQQLTVRGKAVIEEYRRQRGIET